MDLIPHRTSDAHAWFSAALAAAPGSEEPDLDRSDPRVRTEMESVLRFWLEHGVDATAEATVLVPATTGGAVELTAGDVLLARAATADGTLPEGASAWIVLH